MSRLTQFFFHPINPSIIGLYRIIFGLFMIYQMLYYFEIDYTYQFMAGPEMLFHYEGLSFLKPLPLGILQLIHVLLLLSAVLITLGWQYRKAMVFFFLGFTYFSFIDKTLYNNHLYLISLLSFVMIFTQADLKYSLKTRWLNKKVSAVVPAWNQYILMFLISLTYMYGGIAKLGYNWLGSNLVERMIELNPSGILTSLLPKDILMPLITYGGLIYDLGIVWLLLYKRTRILGVILVVIFNLTNNSVLFDDIGLFPFFMICSTLLFFNSEKVGVWIDSKIQKKKNAKTLTKKQQKRLLKEQAKNSKTIGFSEPELVTVYSLGYKKKQVTSVLLCVFIGFHLLFPLRHYAFTDNPEWYGAGMFFAWRMKMQTKEVLQLNMRIMNSETGEYGPIEAKTFLSNNQFIHLLDDPDNLVLFANYLSPKASKEYGIEQPAINADIEVRFNGLPAQQMIRPEVDLSQLTAEDVSDRSYIFPLVKK